MDILFQFWDFNELYHAIVTSFENTQGKTATLICESSPHDGLNLKECPMVVRPCHYDDFLLFALADLYSCPLTAVVTTIPETPAAGRSIDEISA